MHRWMFVMLVVSGLSGCVFSHGSGSGGGDDDDGDDDDSGWQGGGSVPDDLVGEWYAGRGGTSAPYDPVSGGWGRPNGEGLVYLFEADGTYTKAFQSYASNGGCTTGFTAFESGRLTVAGSTFTTRPSSGHLVFEDTCSPSLDSDDPLESLEDETFTWELRPSELDPADTVLWLQRTDGAESTFAPL